MAFFKRSLDESQIIPQNTDDNQAIANLITDMDIDILNQMSVFLKNKINDISDTQQITNLFLNVIKDNTVSTGDPILASKDKIDLMLKAEDDRKMLENLKNQLSPEVQKFIKTRLVDFQNKIKEYNIDGSFSLIP